MHRFRGVHGSNVAKVAINFEMVKKSFRAACFVLVVSPPNARLCQVRHGG